MSSTAGKAPLPRTVLVYSHSWLPGQVDGVAIRMMAHVKALVERGSKVTVVTPDFSVDGQQAPELNAIPGVEHITLKTIRTPVYRKNLCMELSLRNLFALMAAIRRVRPEVVHGAQEASMQVLATACILCNVPLVVSMHTDVASIASADAGFSTLGGLAGRVHARLAVLFSFWGYRNWALAGTYFFPVSKQARSMLRDAGVRDARVAPIEWGPMVDRQTFRIDRPEKAVAASRERLTFGLPDAYLLVYMGRITAEKDIRFLVDALERAPRRVVLALVGAGSMVPELKKLHGPEHRLYCTGDFVDREEVANCLRAADCCVSASVMETVGFTAMETLSCGTPMLAARAQGFAEHLSHGVNARLFTPGDATSFDQELAAMMATKPTGTWSPEALRASMDAASVETCTDRALHVYRGASVPNLKGMRVAATLFMLCLNVFFSTLLS